MKIQPIGSSHPRKLGLIARRRPSHYEGSGVSISGSSLPTSCSLTSRSTNQPNQENSRGLSPWRACRDLEKVGSRLAQCEKKTLRNWKRPPEEERLPVGRRRLSVGVEEAGGEVAGMKPCESISKLLSPYRFLSSSYLLQRSDLIAYK